MAAARGHLRPSFLVLQLGMGFARPPPPAGPRLAGIPPTLAVPSHKALAAARWAGVVRPRLRKPRRSAGTRRLVRQRAGWLFVLDQLVDLGGSDRACWLSSMRAGGL